MRKNSNDELKKKKRKPRKKRKRLKILKSETKGDIELWIHSDI